MNRVLESRILAQGPEVAAFENEFSATVQGRHCAAVNSWASVLHLGLLAAGVGPGDEVIVPSSTFAATANAVVLSGATPVFVDIDSATYRMSPEVAVEAVGPRTTALLSVHLFGHLADLPELIALAQRNGLMVFEDATQAHLSEHSGIPVGCHRSVAAFSFYSTKSMTTG